MKQLLFLFLFFYSFSSFSQELTTYYLVRHAEKDRTDKSNSNPELTEIGFERAVKWSTVFENVRFCLLYTSDAADDSLRVDLGGRRIIKKIYEGRWVGLG